MKLNEINAKFTAKVAEYIANGYTINPRTMSGHQGEVGKIDFVKGNELIRVWLNSESSSNWRGEQAWHGSMLVLRVSKWNIEFHESAETVWESDLITIEEYTYFAIGGYYNSNWFVDSLDEALEYQRKHYARYRRDPNTPPTKITDSKAIEIAGNWLKRRHGYQRLSWDKIELYKYNNSRRYVIEYNNHRYLLG